ncbi:hypothetical protein, partial [Aequorivita sp. Q41]|uniref:hypothetical protein n=1 Tax=Aequorivita sp. Q41 TaxID=3153300 RepID=UPI003242CE36
FKNIVLNSQKTTIKRSTYFSIIQKTSYIQFEFPKNEQKTERDGIIKRNLKKAFSEIFSAIIPKANPDFEDKFDLVEKWIIELDNETGIPQREIGMDKRGRIIVKMPFKKNYGFWTDSNLVFTDFISQFDTSDISRDTFENYWSLFEKTEDFETELTEYKIQSNGADSGRKYLTTIVEFKGQNREIIILFTDKSDEEKITGSNKIKVRGKVVDDGIEQSLTLYETKLVTE